MTGNSLEIKRDVHQDNKLFIVDSLLFIWVQQTNLNLFN